MDAAAAQRLQSHYRGLYGFALTLAGTGDEARDLVQEAALKALAANNVPADATAFRVWLFRILHNTWRDRVRHDRASPKAPVEDIDRHVHLGEWVTLHERSINALAVRMSFAKLSRDHQQVMALIDVAGFKYGEASALLQIPVGTVMSRLARARQALLAAMGEARVIPIARASARSKP